MRKSGRSNERNRRKKIVSKAVIAMLTASLVVSGPAASVHAGTPVGGNSAVMLTAEQTTTININECRLTDGAIKVEFTQNGSYILTRSNLVGDKRIDATFTVPSDKEVDIYLDGVDIYNGYYLSPGCSSKDAKPVFEINGTANIHVSSDSSITGLCDMFKVTGVLNFIESTGEATLTVNRSIYGDFYGTYPMISGDDGKVHYKGAKVTFVNKVKDGEGTTDGDPVPCNGRTYIDCDVIPQTEGGLVRFDDVCLTAYRVLGADSLVLKDSNTKLHDIYGHEVSKSTITGLPEGGEVVQLVTLDDKTANPIDHPDVATRRAVSNLNVDSEGELKNVYLPGCVEMYISSGSAVECYVKNYSNVKEPKPAYKVDFVDKEDTSVSMGSYWGKAGDKVTLLEESGNYNYTYTTDSPEGGSIVVTAETTISADTTIYVTKTAKPRVKITVDDEEMYIDHGATLASAGLDGTYACKETKSIVDPENTTVTESITLIKVDLDTEEKDGKTWFLISNAAQLDKFAKLVTEYGITNINGCLTNDIIPYNGTMIGSNVLEKYIWGMEFDNCNFFRGSFDGAGHTVRFENNSGNTGTLAGLFGSVSAGAEIKNVITAGTVEGTARFTGALVASVICQNGDAVKIDNCINTANVVITSEKKDYIGGLVGGKLVDYTSDPGTQVMGLSITNCVNTGQVFGGSGIIGDCMGSSETIISGCINYGENNLPITTGKSDYVKVYNSYSTYVDELLPRGTQVTKEAFKSGEVAYLLNLGGSTRTWYQSFSKQELYPKTNGEPATETVYRGYASCEATTPIYSNTEIAHKEQGHKAGTEYSYADGKFAAECLYCDKKFTATLNVEDETLDVNPKGATVSYSEEWIAAGCPDIYISYAAEQNGEYSETKPVEAGTCYVKASVGEAVANVNYDIRYKCFANDNVIGVKYCMNDGCERHIMEKSLTLTLCDYDTVDYEEGEREKFKALFGTDAPQIVFYSEGNLLDAAPEKPGTYTAKATLEYAGESFTAKLEFTIDKKTKNQPTGLKAVATGSINGSDGKITGVTSGMEYSADDGKSWNDVTGTEITGLKAGEVFVRYKEDDYYFESSNTSVVVPEHKHSRGTYHETIQGNCVTKGQIEYWECGSSACNVMLDATLNVIEDITGEFDANKHEKTASWVKTAETHKQVYDCCGAEKTAEEAHVYGMEGDARFTCGVCGYVDTDKKAAIEEAEKKAAEEAAKKAAEQNSGSPVIPDISDGGNTGSGSTDSGNTGSGSTDSGNTGSGSTDSGNTGSDITGGNTDSGNIEGDNKGDAGNTKESADTDRPENTDKNSDADETEALSEQQKFEQKVDEKVTSLKKDLGDEVKVVGASNSFSDALKATKENGAYKDASGKILKYSFVSEENGNTYFTNKKGKPVKSAVITDGVNMYYCGKKGNVIKNKAFNLPSGERVLASKTGALVTKSNTRVRINGTYYLVKKNGIVAQREIVKSKTGKLLYADKNGVVVTNKTITFKGVKYIADSNGFLKEVTE